MPILQIRDGNGNFIPINVLNGKSAYEQAKEGGFKGSEEDFIYFLNGELNKTDMTDEGGYKNGQNAFATSGGAIGNTAKATSGGAVGSWADAGMGGAVGQLAKAKGGGAVGYQASEAEGGGAVGNGASVTTGGGAVGESATALNGGAVGRWASTQTGGAVGYDTRSNYGGAVGFQAATTDGGAVGDKAYAGYGGAVGEESYAEEGGAVGYKAKTGDGFAGGKNAKTVRAGQLEDVPIDAIQLGWGTNSIEKTLQVYGYQMMDASGKIPSDRLPIATGSYVGTGTYGEDKPSTLTFPFTPKIVLISGKDATTTFCIPWIYGVTRGYVSNYNSGTMFYSELIWEGNTLTWYAKKGTTNAYPSYQLNNKDTTYYWVAFG